MNPTSDTIYYKFLLDLSVEYNKRKSGDWWVSFEKLRKKYQKASVASNYYTRNLLQKAFVALFKNQILNFQEIALKSPQPSYVPHTYSASKSGHKSYVKEPSQRKIEKAIFDTTYDDGRTDTLLNKTLLDFSPGKTKETEHSKLSGIDDPHYRISTISEIKPNKPSSCSSVTNSRRKSTQLSTNGSAQKKPRSKTPKKGSTPKENKPPINKKSNIQGLKSPNTDSKVNPIKSTGTNLSGKQKFIMTSPPNSHVPGQSKVQTPQAFTPFLGRTVGQEVNKTFDLHNLKSIEPGSEVDIKKDISTQFIDSSLGQESVNLTQLLSLNNKISVSPRIREERLDSQLQLLTEISIQNLPSTLQKDEAFMTSEEYLSLLRGQQKVQKEEVNENDCINQLGSQNSQLVLHSMDGICFLKNSKEVTAITTLQLCRKRKQRLIQLSVKALELNYQNILAKAFVGLGVNAVRHRTVIKKYEHIKKVHNHHMIAEYFTNYKIAFNQHVIEKVIGARADSIYFRNLATQKLQAWKQVTDSRKKKVKSFQTAWQPKILLELICHAFDINPKKAYHTIFNKISHKLHVPKSREFRVMNSISILNDHLLIKSFAIWKIYKEKCLNLRLYRNQLIERKAFIFWKHYSLKRSILNRNEAALIEKKTREAIQTILTSWKIWAKHQQMLKRGEKLIKFHNNNKSLNNYFSLWINGFIEITREKNLTLLAYKSYKRRILTKSLRMLAVHKDNHYHSKIKNQTALTFYESKEQGKFFRAWLKFHLRKALLNKRKNQYLSNFNQQLITFCLKSWRQEYKDAIKVYQVEGLRLKKKVIYGLQVNWEIQQNAYEIIEKKIRLIEKRKLRCYYKGFSEFLFSRIDKRNRIENFQNKKTYRIVNNTFRQLNGYAKIKQQKFEENERVTEIRNTKILSHILLTMTSFAWAKKREGLIANGIRNEHHIRLLTSHFRAWRVKYLKFSEERLKEEYYIAKYQKKILTNVFGYLERGYLKIRQKSRIAKDQFFLRNASKILAEIKKYAIRKLVHKQKIEVARKKTHLKLLGKIMKSIQKIAKDNEAKRAQRFTANLHYFNTLLKKSMKTLRASKNSRKLLKKTRKRLSTALAKYYLNTWREELALSKAKRKLKFKFELRSIKKVFGFLKKRMTQAQKVYAFIQSSLIKIANKVINEFKRIREIGKKRAKLQLLKKEFDLKYWKRNTLKTWVRSYKRATQCNKLAEEFILKHEERIKRFFMDILSIKMQKKQLRDILLERHQEKAREIYLRKYFNAYVEGVLIMKSYKKVQFDYTYRKDQMLVGSAFEKLKEILELSKRKTLRATSLSERVRENQTHAILESWKTWTEKRIRIRHLGYELHKRSCTKIKTRAMARWLEEYLLMKKTSLISTRFEEYII